MSSSELGEIIAPGTIRFVRRFPGTIDRVWQALVDPVERGRWLAPGPMDLRVGGSVELHFSLDEETAPPRAKGACEATVKGRVTKCDPPCLLAFTWGEGGSQVSEVTFELKSEGGSVVLTLTHRRLDTRGEMIDVASGWTTHLGILEDVLSGNPPRPFWEAHEVFMDRYGELIPE